MSEDTVTFTDNATDKQVELPMRRGTLGPGAVDIGRFYRETGYFTYDPGFLSTASCHSALTYIDGEQGQLMYRGYPIEQLAKHSNFIEVAYLLLYGELPDERQLDDFRQVIVRHTMLNEYLKGFFRGFYHDAHPMAIMVGVVGSLSAFYHDSTDITDPEHREVAAIRLIAKMPTIAAASYKYSIGQPFSVPGQLAELQRQPSAHDVLGAVRGIRVEPGRGARTRADVHPARRSRAERQHLDGAPGRQLRRESVCLHRCGIATLWGPAHGGANEAVIDDAQRDRRCQRMSRRSSTRAKDQDDPFRLMGFGHRVYKNYDPRARIIRETCHEVLAKLGDANDPLFEMALKLEEIALQRRLLHRAQAVSECRFLLRPDLQGARHPDEHVHGDVRHRPHRGLGGAVDGDDRGGEPAHRPAAATVYRPGTA